MRSGNLAILMATMVCGLPAPVLAQSSSDWVDIKDPKELRALFSNKTHRGKGADGTPYVVHFSSDGRGLLLYVGQQYPRTWEVRGSEVCVTATRAADPTSGTICRTYQRHKTNRNDIVGRVSGRINNQFTVEEGVPKF